MLPNLSYIPMAFAGLTAAHFIALSNGIFIFLTAVLTQFIRLVTEPAIFPSFVSVATFPFTVTSNPPSVY